MPESKSVVQQRLAPLRATYTARPEEAVIHKRASAVWDRKSDAFHGDVVIGSTYGATWRFGIDRAIGGDHDLPNPAEILCAALAACTDATIRMVADSLGVALECVEVEVVGVVDVRGCLAMNAHTPVGFQVIRSRVRLRAAPAVRQEVLQRLCQVVERACITLETLRKGVPVEVSYDVQEAGREEPLSRIG